MATAFSYSLDISKKLGKSVDNRQYICYNAVYCHNILISESKGFGEAIVSSLSEKTRMLRRAMKWSQEDLAREVGVSLSTVQRWETKGGRPIRLARRELDKLFRKAGLRNDK